MNSMSMSDQRNHITDPSQSGLKHNWVIAGEESSAIISPWNKSPEKSFNIAQ